MYKIINGIELIELKKLGFNYETCPCKGWYLRDWFKNTLIKVDIFSRKLIIYSHNDTVLARLYELFELGYIERC